MKVSLKEKLNGKKKSERVKLQNEDNPYGFNYSDLLDTAAIVLSGSQYAKIEEFLNLTNRSGVGHTTHYRYLPVLERIVQKLQEEEKEKLAALIKEKHEDGTLGNLMVAIDGAWNQRGHTSELGNFAAVLISPHECLNNKVLYLTSKSFTRTKWNKKKERDQVVHQGNHEGKYLITMYG